MAIEMTEEREKLIRDIEEVDEYFNKKIKEHHQKNGIYYSTRYITKALCKTITDFVTEQPHKDMTIRIMLKIKPYYITKFCNAKYISEEDILRFEKDYPEIYYYITPEMYTDNILEHMLKNEDVVYDFLSEDLRKNAKIQEKFKQTKKIYNLSSGRDNWGYDQEWLDREGKIRKFFTLKNNFPINSKEEYMVIINAYLCSELSIASFCNLYGIKDIEGFKDLLKRICDENIDNIDEVRKVKEIASTKYLVKIKDLGNKLGNGELSFEEYLKYYYGPVHKFKLMFEYTDNKLGLMTNIVDYIKNNKDSLMLDKILDLFDTSLKNFKTVLNSYCNMGGLRIINRNVYLNINSYIKPYARPFILTTIIKDGNKYVIDDNIADQAYAYLKDNGIYICHYTMSLYTQKIAFGEINYLEEKETKKEELKEEILSLAIKKAHNIQEYMNIMEEHNIQKIMKRF